MPSTATVRGLTKRSGRAQDRGAQRLLRRRLFGDPGAERAKTASLSALRCSALMSSASASVAPRAAAKALARATMSSMEAVVGAAGAVIGFSLSCLSFFSSAGAPRRARLLSPTSPCPPPNLFISLRRRALTPFAWLRAYARGALAPSGPDGPVGRRGDEGGDSITSLSSPRGRRGRNGRSRWGPLSALQGGEGQGEVGVFLHGTRRVRVGAGSSRCPLVVLPLRRRARNVGGPGAAVGPAAARRVAGWSRPGAQ